MSELNKAYTHANEFTVYKLMKTSVLMKLAFHTRLKFFNLALLGFKFFY